MVSIGFTLLLAAVAAERVAELVVSRRNERRSLAAGGQEHGRAHYPAMVVLHVGLLVGAFAEVQGGGRPWLPGLGWPALALVLAAQGLRWWCIRTLGPHWNTRVIVVPGLDRVRTGPYAWFAHPNYLAVVLEGLALPLVHTAWLTAVLFTLLNALLLRVRIRTENAALRSAEDAPPVLRRPGGGTG